MQDMAPLHIEPQSDWFEQAQRCLDMTVEAEVAEARFALSRSALNNGHKRGICVDCGEPISPGRLKAIPSAARCIHCQEEVESVARSCRLAQEEDARRFILDSVCADSACDESACEGSVCDDC